MTPPQVRTPSICEIQMQSREERVYHTFGSCSSNSLKTPVGSPTKPELPPTIYDSVSSAEQAVCLGSDCECPFVIVHLSSYHDTLPSAPSPWHPLLTRYWLVLDSPTMFSRTLTWAEVPKG